MNLTFHSCEVAETTSYGTTKGVSSSFSPMINSTTVKSTPSSGHRSGYGPMLSVLMFVVFFCILGWSERP